MWDLVFGIWPLALAFGIWHLAFGIWHLALALAFDVDSLTYSSNQAPERSATRPDTNARPRCRTNVRNSRNENEIGKLLNKLTKLTTKTKVKGVFFFFFSLHR